MFNRIKNILKNRYQGFLVDTAFRYLPIARRIKKSGKKNPSILDVGSGGLGITPYLKMPVTGADVKFEEPISDFLRPVKIDGVNLPFSNREFDFVVSVDMVEHLPPDQREKMICELMRVAKGRLFLAIPLGKEAEKQDRQLDKVCQKLRGSRDPFLIEHILYGLPTKEWVEKVIHSCSKKQKRNIKVNFKKNLNLKARYVFQRMVYSKIKILNRLNKVISLFPFIRHFLNFGECYRYIFMIFFEE